MRHAYVLSLGLISSLFTVACGATGPTNPSGGGDGGSGAATSNGGNGAGTSNGGNGAGTSNGGAGAGTSSDGGGGSGGGECAPGTADCNANAADGCETNLQGDVNNCGACGLVCEGGAGVPPACVVGKCKLDCPFGMADCNMDKSDGCETNTLTDPQNCGSCNLSCGGSQCVAGACACAAETTKANFAPLDLYIMLDQSGSMSETVGGGGTRWQATTTALKAFISDPANAALGVGIQYFPLQGAAACNPFCTTNADCGAFGPCFFGICFLCSAGGSDSCDPADYATPEVGIGQLAPPQVTALTNSINAHGPTNNTPTGPALQGAINHSKQWAMTHPGHNVVVVLATDGEPTGCTPSDIPGIANVAAQGVNGSPSIKTFVIGVGPLLSNLNAIAAGGGTGQAFLVSDANVVQQFQAALESIQQSVLGCEYAIPQPMAGTLDYNKVNVQYTPGNGGAPQVILNVPDAAGCDPASGGWYYDSNASPTKIVLCPQTCGPIKADATGKLDILLGCATEHI